MVAFAPGELATIAGPLGIDDGENNWTTKSFNFDDLPCPPQNVMVNTRRHICRILN